MMKRFLLVFSIVGTSLYGGPSEQTRPQKLILPSSAVQVFPMANNPGQFGAYFKTKVALFNPNATALPIGVTLYNSGQVKQVTLPMDPGQLRNYDNFLQEVFSYSGAGMVKFENNGTGYDFIVSAEVYTESSCGKYITSLVPLSPPLDATAILQGAYSLGIDVDANSRTNVGALNASSDSANEVNADVYDASGKLVGTVTLALEPSSWKQVPVPFNVTGGYIQWRPATAAYFYAVVVNNTSNDGTFIPPVVHGE